MDSPISTFPMLGLYMCAVAPGFLMWVLESNLRSSGSHACQGSTLKTAISQACVFLVLLIWSIPSYKHYNFSWVYGSLTEDCISNLLVPSFQCNEAEHGFL